MHIPVLLVCIWHSYDRYSLWLIVPYLTYKWFSHPNLRSKSWVVSNPCGCARVATLSSSTTEWALFPSCGRLHPKKKQPLGSARNENLISISASAFQHDSAVFYQIIWTNGVHFSPPSTPRLAEDLWRLTSFSPFLLLLWFFRHVAIKWRHQWPTLATDPVVWWRNVRKIIKHAHDGDRP